MPLVFPAADLLPIPVRSPNRRAERRTATRPAAADKVTPETCIAHDALQNPVTRRTLHQTAPQADVAPKRQRDSEGPSRDTVVWPALGTLGLSPAAIAERVECIGGSDANTILSGSGERILRLWREKRGQEAPEDLSDKLPVMLGSWTEAFNRQWYEKLVGHTVTRVGERLRCPVRA